MTFRSTEFSVASRFINTEWKQRVTLFITLSVWFLSHERSCTDSIAQHLPVHVFMLLSHAKYYILGRHMLLRCNDNHWLIFSDSLNGTYHSGSSSGCLCNTTASESDKWTSAKFYNLTVSLEKDTVFHMTVHGIWSHLLCAHGESLCCCSPCFKPFHVETWKSKTMPTLGNHCLHLEELQVGGPRPKPHLIIFFTYYRRGLCVCIGAMWK